MAMPVPKDVNTLKSFLGQVQFYGKFLPPNLYMTLDPLYRLNQGDLPWQWASEQHSAFENVKQLLSFDSVLTHFNPSKPLGMATDASEVGIGFIDWQMALNVQLQIYRRF